MLMAPHPFILSPTEKVFIVLLVWVWVKSTSNALILWLNSLFIKKLIQKSGDPLDSSSDLYQQAPTQHFSCKERAHYPHTPLGFPSRTQQFQSPSPAAAFRRLTLHLLGRIWLSRRRKSSWQWLWQAQAPKTEHTGAISAVLQGSFPQLFGCWVGLSSCSDFPNSLCNSVTQLLIQSHCLVNVPWWSQLLAKEDKGAVNYSTGALQQIHYRGWNVIYFSLHPDFLLMDFRVFK